MTMRESEVHHIGISR